jgi:hypothetical protein
MKIAMKDKKKRKMMIGRKLDIRLNTMKKKIGIKSSKKSFRLLNQKQLKIYRHKYHLKQIHKPLQPLQKSLLL